jgi:HEAT repeats/HEAT repeat
VLHPLAFHMHLHCPSGLIEEEQLAEYVAGRLAKMRNKQVGYIEGRQVQEFLERVKVHTGLIVERGRGRFGFLHLLFEEYLAGQHLADDPDLAVELIQELRHRTRWEEPIRLAIAAQSPKAAARLIRKGVMAPPSHDEEILHRDLFLVARCLGDCETVEPELALRVTNSVLDLLREIGPFNFKWASHADDALVSLHKHTISAEVIETRLLELLKTPEPNVRAAAAELCRDLKLSSDFVVTELMRALTDNEWQVRQAAAEALGSIGSDRAVDALLVALKDNDHYVRSAAAEALGNIGSDRALDALILAMKDDDWYVRSKAAEALGKLGISNPTVLAALSAQFSDMYDVVRSAAFDSYRTLTAKLTEERPIPMELLEQM